MSTRLEHPHEGCLFSAMRLTEKIALKKPAHFFKSKKCVEN